MPIDPTLLLSPSLANRRRLEETAQELRYPGADPAAWQGVLRARIAGLIGFEAATAGPSPAVRTLWRRSHPLGTIEKLAFRAGAEADATAYLCLPASASPPYDCFICLQGHTSGMHHSIGVAFDDETTPIAIEDDHDFGLSCMRHGLAAFCLEQRSFGERRETLQPQSLDYLCHQAAMNALMLGTTLLADRIRDIDRAIDLLAARGDMVMSRLGVMGTSGGGTTAMFAATLLPRLACAMPSGCFSTFAASVQARFHCVCNYVPGLLLVAEMGDLCGLIAPRPLLVVSGERDGLFPIAQARSEFARVAGIYADLGASDRCRHLVGDGGHRFYADAAWPAMIGLVRPCSAG